MNMIDDDTGLYPEGCSGQKHGRSLVSCHQGGLLVCLSCPVPGADRSGAVQPRGERDHPLLWSVYHCMCGFMSLL